MNTERLTPDEMLRKWSEITYPNLDQIARISIQNAMRAYADQEVERNTKQLQGERDVLFKTLKRCFPKNEPSYFALLGASRDAINVINKLSQEHEG